MEMDIKKLRKAMKEELDGSRYHHTLGVAYTAASLAMRYHYDMEKAFVAGLLHDCAKCIEDSKKLEICEKNKIPVTPVERRNPFLLHAKLGGFFAETKYGITDQEIVDAICYHSTGRVNMTLLDKIIFTADYIEPGRDKARNLKEIREMAFDNLDCAMVVIMHDTLEYLDRTQSEKDPMTQEAYEYYKERQTLT